MLNFRDTTDKNFSFFLVKVGNIELYELEEQLKYCQGEGEVEWKTEVFEKLVGKTVKN